jgi:hypothetical protein
MNAHKRKCYFYDARERITLAQHLRPFPFMNASLFLDMRSRTKVTAIQY